MILLISGIFIFLAGLHVGKLFAITTIDQNHLVDEIAELKIKCMTFYEAEHLYLTKKAEHDDFLKWKKAKEKRAKHPKP